MILAIATLSAGKDEIFDPQFSPAKLQIPADGNLISAPRVEVDPMMQKVADSLVSSDGGRHVRFGGPTKEDKLAMQIRKSEQLIEKQRAVQEKLK